MPKNILKGKNCLITGATGSLGICICRELAAKGCNLFLISKTNSKLMDLKAQIEAEFHDIRVDYAACDVQKIDDIYDVLKKVHKNFGTIDILINSAGIVQFDSLLDTTVEDFDAMFNINVRATFIFCKELVNDMIRKRWGRIVNIGSKSSYIGYPKTSIYCASKHAVLGFTRSLLKELTKYNIRAICIAPGAILSEMGKEVVRKHHLNPETFIDPKEAAEYLVYAISFDTQMISEEVILSRIDEYNR